MEKWRIGGARPRRRRAGEAGRRRGGRERRRAGTWLSVWCSRYAASSDSSAKTRSEEISTGSVPIAEGREGRRAGDRAESVGAGPGKRGEKRGKECACAAVPRLRRREAIHRRPGSDPSSRARRPLFARAQELDSDAD
jgi:hypothetical protein